MDSIKEWFRRVGNDSQSLLVCSQVNKRIFKAALHYRKGRTLDIDETEIIANKSDAQWA